MTAPANTNAAPANAVTIVQPTNEAAQFAEIISKLADTNRKLVWELEKVNTEGRASRNDAARLRAENARLEKENATLARGVVKLTDDVDDLEKAKTALELMG